MPALLQRKPGGRLSTSDLPRIDRCLAVRRRRRAYPSPLFRSRIGQDTGWRAASKTQLVTRSSQPATKAGHQTSLPVVVDRGSCPLLLTRSIIIPTLNTLDLRAAGSAVASHRGNREWTTMMSASEPSSVTAPFLNRNHQASLLSERDGEMGSKVHFRELAICGERSKAHLVKKAGRNGKIRGCGLVGAAESHRKGGIRSCAPLV
ncbi:uncharacterized protein B0I36DRAFT_35184 [Microdochium trichocladiopsis]|uniref:Uncharacterized protein n=1 Tax=Microdochium trichocladiopsis TaxID=1682393 RepID=A0A9P8XTU4_9PEZI|nr:uncharacterized protein B0I36DRAFT_35184 [Microdochium trichocladiopsis]KAH7018009.1 hypothetical protein B0I36DRAFT_35184 [Microdochium trichocladiopsis]